MIGNVPANMAFSLDDIEQLFSLHGAQMYSGEPVTQLHGHVITIVEWNRQRLRF